MEKVTFTTDLSLETNEAFASIVNNPNVSLAKFVFTDDRPNKNKMRIPKEEFANVLQTGILMPVKMASGEISTGHDGTTPLGVISHLKEEDNKVLGLAAFWKAEREDDIALLKAMADEGNNPKLSWEVWYDHMDEEDDGTQVLRGVIVRATTIVGLPAYGERTPILALSSENSDVKNQSSEVLTMTEEELKSRIAELEAELAECKRKLDEKASVEEEFNATKSELETSKTDLETLKTDLASKDEALNSKEEELVSLREFKAEIEKKEAEATRISEIKAKFAENGISKDENYFVENKDRLLKMDAETLEFIMQELVMASAKQTAESSTKEKKTDVPQIFGEPAVVKNPKELAKQLRAELK